MIVSEYLQGKMGKREFGKLLDRIAKITHDCRRPDCVRCDLARNFDKVRDDG